jgi:hypothetical protein
MAMWSNLSFEKITTYTKNLNKKHIKKEQPASTSSLSIKASTLVSLPQTKKNVKHT